MEKKVEKIRETKDSDGNIQRTHVVHDSASDQDHKQNVAGRAIWFIAGIVIVLLAFRLLLSLLGANTSNGFANFIYSSSHPFVSPFFNLFSYNSYQYGVSRFEVYTVVAMLVYLVVAWGLVRLVTINRYRNTTV